MRAERRHELRENDLLHYLQVTRDYFREHGGRIGVACIVVVAAALAVSFGIRSRAAAHEDIYRRKDLLTFEDVESGRKSLESLAALVKDSTDEQFILKALLEEGRQALRLAGMVPFPPDPALNERAGQAFEALRRRFADNPLAVGVALNGLATVQENEFASDEDFSHKEKARDYLTALVKNPEMNRLTFQRIALDRLEALDETFTTVALRAPALTPEELAELDAKAAQAAAEEEAKAKTEGQPEGKPGDDAKPDAAVESDEDDQADNGP